MHIAVCCYSTENKALIIAHWVFNSLNIISKSLADCGIINGGTLYDCEIYYFPILYPQKLKSILLLSIMATLKHYTDTVTIQLYITSSAFTDGFFLPTLSQGMK